MIFKKKLQILIISGLLGLAATSFSQENVKPDELVREIQLEWEPVKKASKYQLKLKNKTTGKIKKHTVKKSIWKGELAVGDYLMIIRSYDKRGVPGPWATPIPLTINLPQIELLLPKNLAKVKTESNEKQLVQFSWKSVPQVKIYQFNIESKDKKFKKIFDSKLPELKADLDVAQQYQWSVQAIMEDDTKTPFSKPNKFILLGKKLDKPIIKHEEKLPIRKIIWSRPFGAQHYNIAILKENKNKKWKVIDKYRKSLGQELLLKNNYADGNYKVVIKAIGKYRLSSDLGQLNFQLNTARDLAAIMKMKKPDPSPFYAMASYHISQINYSSRYREVSSTDLSIQPINGIGRLGFGYLKPGSTKGYQFVMDTAGFNLAGRPKIYTSIELQAIFQNKQENGSFTQWSLGVYNKELPLLYESSGSTERFNVSQPGFLLGFTNMYQLSEKYGLEANIYSYFGTQMGKTPQKNAPNPSLSAKLEANVKYHLNYTMTGYLGYAFNYESFRFSNTTDPEQNNNSIDIYGSYITFKFKLDF